MEISDTAVEVVPVGRTTLRTVRAFTPPSVRSLSDAHQANLAVVAHTFARAARTWLTTRCRADVRVSMAPATRWTWGELLDRLGEPYCAASFDPAPLGHPGLITVDLPLAWHLVDRVLGGQGEVTETNARLSEVGVEVMREVQSRLVADLAAAMAVVLQFTPIIARQVSRLELVRTARPDVGLVVLPFTVRVGDHEGLLQFAVPATEVIDALDALDGDHAAPLLGGSIEGRLQDASVAVSVRFDPGVATPTTLLRLAVGDVLPVPHPRTRPLTVFVGETPMFAATAGRRGDRLAIAVTGAPNRPTGTASGAGPRTPGATR